MRGEWSCRSASYQLRIKGARGAVHRTEDRRLMSAARLPLQTTERTKPDRNQKMFSAVLRNAALLENSGR